ncbi:MAG TPA: YicC/YloC family endoribonuclease [Kofleriaceae bacterium]|jgi:uncharacterized protein (TIGR00255 family)
MTGFGRGTAEQAGVRATIDVRSVNHRFVDLKLRMQVAPALEEAIATRVRGAVERGAITVSLRVDHPVDRQRGTGAIRLDAARAAHAELSALASELGIAGPDLALVLAQPGVVAAADAEADQLDAAILAALAAALRQLREMREVEGRVLAIELNTRLDALARLRGAIDGHAASVPEQLHSRLHERLRRLLGDAVIDPARLAQEVALLAERADVTEELVRLGSHLEQARALIAGASASGRRLDFLVQEIGRELNTIGSKSQHAEISAAVVEAKAILEKVREQVQNVE